MADDNKPITVEMLQVVVTEGDDPVMLLDYLNARMEAAGADVFNKTLKGKPTIDVHLVLNRIDDNAARWSVAAQYVPPKPATLGSKTVFRDKETGLLFGSNPRQPELPYDGKVRDIKDAKKE